MNHDFRLSDMQLNRINQLLQDMPVAVETLLLNKYGVIDTELLPATQYEEIIFDILNLSMELKQKKDI